MEFLPTPLRRSIGSCELLAVYPDTKCFKEVPFQVVNHAGSVIVSCATSINLNLIQPQGELNSRFPNYGRLVYSCADDPGNHKYKKMRSNVNMCDKAYCISKRDITSGET